MGSGTAIRYTGFACGGHPCWGSARDGIKRRIIYMEKAWEAGLPPSTLALPTEGIRAEEAAVAELENILYLWKKRGERGCKPLPLPDDRGASALGNNLWRR